MENECLCFDTRKSKITNTYVYNVAPRTFKEVNKAIHCMKCDKIPGIDGVNTEALIFGKSLTSYYQLFNTLS